MAQHKKRRIAVFLVYILLFAGIIWQAVALASMFRPGGKFLKIKSYNVAVTGDVRRPGLYRVPEGTTNFEILKVAGVRPTSDLSRFNLTSAVNENSELQVDSREQGAVITPQPVLIRLEFYYGDVTITSKEGRSMPVQEGISLGQGDRIQTELSSQAELSLGSFSRIDMDAFAELSLDKLAITPEGEMVMELFQKTGACWYKIAFGDKKESLSILTPASIISISGSGADFLCDIQPDQAIINCMDGLLTIERSDASESVNLLSGQSASIYNDGRPVQTSRLAPDMSASERFTQLSQEKKSVMVRGQPLNFLFCSTPVLFFIVSAHFEKGVVYTIHVPQRLLVEQFAQGIQTFDEAYLYGGPSFINSILERMLNIRLSRYTVFTKQSVLKTTDILGGINATLDQKSSSLLRMKPGSQKLTSQNLITYLSPSYSSSEDAKARQRQVLKALFESLRNRSIVLTTITSQQILALIESNFTAAEVMDFYLRFTSSGTMKQKDFDLPVTEQRIKGRVVYEPDLEKCRQIIEAN